MYMCARFVYADGARNGSTNASSLRNYQPACWVRNDAKKHHHDLNLHTLYIVYLKKVMGSPLPPLVGDKNSLSGFNLALGAKKQSPVSFVGRVLP